MANSIKPAVVFLVALGIITAYAHPAPYNNYSLLAQAILGGHVWVTTPGSFIDTIPYNGMNYVIEAPFPALLTLPFVALWGPSGLSETVPSVIAGAVAVTLLWLIAVKIGLSLAPRIALCVFALFGTDLLWCSSTGWVWFISPVVAMALTLGAIYECLGKKRGWLIGVLAFCAFESRGTLAPAFLLYLLVLWRCAGKEAVRNYLIVLTCGVFIWMGYNEARWGTLNDIGYWLWCNQDVQCTGGLFSFKYLFYEVYAFFVRTPELLQSGNNLRYPYLTITPEGLSLTFTSTALIAAVWAPRIGRVLLLWTAAILVAIPSFLYYVDGTMQVGMRHALDFEPFLLVLMGYSFLSKMRWWYYPLIALSVVIGLWEVWFFHAYMA